MRNLLRACAGIAALAGLAWLVLPGITTTVVHPAQSQTMIARALVIAVAFAIAWACLGMATGRPPSRREITTAVSVAGLILIAGVGLYGYSSYQERQTKVAADECAKKLAQSRLESAASSTTAAPLDFELSVWVNCG